MARPFGLLPTDSLLSAMAGPPMLSRRCHFQGPDGEKIGINILRNIQIYIYIYNNSNSTTSDSEMTK